MSITAIPKDILNKQICSECANYLSVGPIVVSPEGDIICGRCPGPSKASISLYNLLSENISFTCINYHAGCEQLLRMTETAQHEDEVCENDKNFECPLCYFKGNSGQLFAHFGKLHVNSIIKGSSFEEILSYSHLKNFVDSILNMEKHCLRLFICMAVKMFSVCTRCNAQFAQKSDVYLCPEYHLLCETCFVERCSKCNVPCELNKKTKLHDILLECEWHRCCEKRNIFQYVSHKQVCCYRLHGCPSKNCNYVGVLKSLMQHWHLNYLINSDMSYSPSYQSAKYWLIPHCNEIVYVTCDDTPDLISYVVSVDDKNLISPFSFQLNSKKGIIHWHYKPLSHIKYAVIPFDSTIICVSKISSK